MLLLFVRRYCYTSFFFSIEVFSWCLIILSIFICSFIIISSIEFSIHYSGRNFLFLVFIILISLVFVFLSGRVFFFYIFFEFSVIPIFFIICGLGYSFERLESGVYIFFYTLTFSLPFLLFIFILLKTFKTISFIVRINVYSSFFDYFFVFFSILIFFVKVPSFFLHLWLPKAHVEAPVRGSIILAGLLLKLGIYGLYIFIPFIFYQLLVFIDFFFIWGIWGAFLSSFICFRQVDLKKIIAFMSIMHMGIVISRVFSYLFYSAFGIFLILLAHGLSSSAIFYSLNCFYERVFSRRLFMLKGGSYYFPSLFFWFTVVVSSNISLPPSINFFSELILVFSILHVHIINYLVLFSLVFIGSLVSFHILIVIFHGFSLYHYSIIDLSIKEILILFCHILLVYTSFIFI